MIYSCRTNKEIISQFFNFIYIQRIIINENILGIL